MKHRTSLALTGMAIALTAALTLPGAASAGHRYDFAYGGGKQARMWLSSQWNPGTCTIDSDAYFVEQAPQLNTVDSVVLSPVRLGLAGRRLVPVSWGAGTVPPGGAQLLIRFVDTVGTGCPNRVVTLPTPGAFSIDVPTGYDLMVVTATEGTVQPWFVI